jgi:hypothetical protein
MHDSEFRKAVMFDYLANNLQLQFIKFPLSTWVHTQRSQNETEEKVPPTLPCPKKWVNFLAKYEYKRLSNVIVNLQAHWINRDNYAEYITVRIINSIKYSLIIRCSWHKGWQGVLLMRENVVITNISFDKSGVWLNFACSLCIKQMVWKISETTYLYTVHTVWNKTLQGIW